MPGTQEGTQGERGANATGERHTLHVVRTGHYTAIGPPSPPALDTATQVRGLLSLKHAHLAEASAPGTFRSTLTEGLLMNGLPDVRLPPPPLLEGHPAGTGSCGHHHATNAGQPTSSTTPPLLPGSNLGPRPHPPRPSPHRQPLLQPCPPPSPTPPARDPLPTSADRSPQTEALNLRPAKPTPPAAAPTLEDVPLSEVFLIKNEQDV